MSTTIQDLESQIAEIKANTNTEKLVQIYKTKLRFEVKQKIDSFSKERQEIAKNLNETEIEIQHLSTKLINELETYIQQQLVRSKLFLLLPPTQLSFSAEVEAELKINIRDQRQDRGQFTSVQSSELKSMIDKVKVEKVNKLIQEKKELKQTLFELDNQLCDCNTEMQEINDKADVFIANMHFNSLTDEDKLLLEDQSQLFLK